MHNRRFTVLPLALLVAIVALPAKATLVGTSVTGSLTFAGDPSNYFDPGYGFVPATGYLNVLGPTVTISDNTVEFGYDDGASLISADFSDHQLTISDLTEMAGPNNGFQLMFTDSALKGQYVIPNSDSFPLNGSALVGDAITLDYVGGNPAVGQTLTATFTLAPVPEPSDLDLIFVAALLAIAARVARRFRPEFLPNQMSH